MRQTGGMADTSFDPDMWDYETVHCCCVRYHCLSILAKAGQWEMKPISHSSCVDIPLPYNADSSTCAFSPTAAQQTREDMGILSFHSSDFFFSLPCT